MWKKMWRKRQLKQDQIKQHDSLLQDIDEARTHWQDAWVRLEYAHGTDQVDYAIFCLQAAEQRYGMLLRLAKQHAVSYAAEQPAQVGSLTKGVFPQSQAAKMTLKGGN